MLKVILSIDLELDGKNHSMFSNLIRRATGEHKYSRVLYTESIMCLFLKIVSCISLGSSFVGFIQ